MNNVKIVAFSLRVSLSQVSERFSKLIDLTHLFLLSILFQKRTNTEYQLRIIFRHASTAQYNRRR
jgi:hypothetical protein